MRGIVFENKKSIGINKLFWLLVPIFCILLVIFTINYNTINFVVPRECLIDNIISCTSNSCDVISSFTTDYSHSTPDRKHNIRLALKSLNGVVVKSGEEFSFNKVVGKRTEERGYKKALVIFKGSYVEGVGGGVCQVSSTLYNAWLLAGLDTVSVKAHTLPSSYVDLSRDATVSEYIDMVLFNPLESDVKIQTIYDENNITINVLGQRRECEYSLKSETIEVLPFNEDIIELDEVGEDEYFIGKVGYKSRLIITITKGGRVVAKRVLRNDYYIPQNSVKILRKSAVN